MRDGRYYEPAALDENLRLVISQVCPQDPNQRATARVVVQLFEELAAKEASDLESLPQQLCDININEYKGGQITQLIAELHDQALLPYAQDPLYMLLLQQIEAIYEHITQASRPLTVLEAYHSLLVDLKRVLQSGSLRNRVVALSSTRAAGNNLSVFRRRIDDIWRMLDDFHAANQEREQQWDLQHQKHLDLFVSEVSQTITVLSKLNNDEERTALITLLKQELDRHASNYTPRQLAVIQKAYDDCCKGEWNKSVTTIPAWYLPWHELTINRMDKLGEGGFGDVYLAKWLDSEVVVKEVKTLESINSDSFASTWLSCFSESLPNNSARATPIKTIESRKALRTMFEQEVNVWFGLSHPHIIRLFGACHIGTPFFACEYASGGSLDKYLRNHPDEMWTKLFEAALGMQYLQSRGIIHGDLKCNNIMIGNDGKAKVTDFGLSSFEGGSEAEVMRGSG